MIGQVIQEAQMHANIVAHLKSKSPVFPMIYFQEVEGTFGKEIWASTLVMFQHGNVKYHRHHIEFTAVQENEYVQLNKLQWQMCLRCEESLKTRIPGPHDEVVCIVSEQPDYVKTYNGRS